MIWRWKNSIYKYKSLSEKFHKDVRVLKYEDLVGNPQKEVNAIVKWLDVEIQPGLLNVYIENLEFLGVRDAKHHQNIINSISESSVGNWKRIKNSPVNWKN